MPLADVALPHGHGSESRVSKFEVLCNQRRSGGRNGSNSRNVVLVGRACLWPGWPNYKPRSHQSGLQRGRGRKNSARLGSAAHRPACRLHSRAAAGRLSGILLHLRALPGPGRHRDGTRRGTCAEFFRTRLFGQEDPIQRLASGARTRPRRHRAADAGGPREWRSRVFRQRRWPGPSGAAAPRGCRARQPGRGIHFDLGQLPPARTSLVFRSCIRNCPGHALIASSRHHPIFC